MGDHDTMTPSELEAEQQSYMRVAESMRRYTPAQLASMVSKRRHFDQLHPKYKEMFGGDARIEQLFAAWRQCLEVNGQFLQGVSQASDFLFECYWPDGAIKPLYEQPTGLDLDKVGSTVKQFVRDWGEEGQGERQLNYGPLYACMEAYFPERKDRKDVKVLVPGSGLSRLAFEFSLRGFWTQGNEFSHHMLIGGHFLLNHITTANCITLFPYADQSINVHKREDQFRPCLVPDMCPSNAIADLEDKGLEQGEFSMVAGDFLEVYNKPGEAGTWGAVVTCFFIDTAHNIFEYIETIHRLLKPGGVWANVGPLLYHFSDSDEPSVDLSYDELREMIIAFGFTIDEEKRLQSGYTTNLRSMKWTVYNSVYFTARKTGEPTSSMADVFAIQNPHMQKAQQESASASHSHADPHAGHVHSHGGTPCAGHSHDAPVAHTHTN
eukprot:TRINITY_DN74052_c0_g1_i1.p1 TRINITY_DN74052_c0_g1~~TRINITY_DN74052_c0_g1_i1.p1  ORF type:complete len:436 (+),score=166.24 TRINITY_DN74052_c0_g1_i1:51-1358(+)